jgi:hypothetical protein
MRGDGGVEQGRCLHDLGNADCGDGSDDGKTQGNPGNRRKAGAAPLARRV